MIIKESAEDYLEAILVLGNEKGKVRSIDVANYLGYSKPSISVAMKNLRENGYIKIDEQGYIFLEKSGLEIASKTLEKHSLLTDWLISLGVSPETASKDACKMEHAISEESFKAIREVIADEDDISEEDLIEEMMPIDLIRF